MPKDWTPTTTALSADEENTVIRSELFQRVEGHDADVMLAMKLLLRGEPLKDRNRLLCWTRLLNDAVSAYTKEQPSLIGDCIEAARFPLHDKKRTFDVEKSFFGFRPASRIAKLAATKLSHTGATVYPRFMGMGYTPSAEVNQCAMKILAHCARAGMRMTEDDPSEYAGMRFTHEGTALTEKFCEKLRAGLELLNGEKHAFVEIYSLFCRAATATSLRCKL
jgi:hypothetical protein